MTSKKLIINLNNDEHIITEKQTNPNNYYNKTLKSSKQIDIDSNIINSNTKRKNESRNKTDNESYLNNILFDTNIVSKHNLSTNEKSVSQKLPHTEYIDYQEKLDKYLEQQQDIIKKRDKLKSRITNPKYANKQSLYITDLEKCNSKLLKLEKNIKICKNSIKTTNHIQLQNAPLLQNTHIPNRQMIKPFNTGTNTTINTPLQIKKKDSNMHNIFNSSNINSTIVNTNNTNNIVNNNIVNNTTNQNNNTVNNTTNQNNNTVNNTTNQNNNIVNNTTNQNNNTINNNKNINITDIENELNKLESELKLSHSIIPTVTNKNIHNNINNTKKPSKNTKDNQNDKEIQDQLNNKSKNSSSPITINSQLRTLREKENFYKEQQRRIQEKFKTEMHKINKLKLQKTEMERLKSLDKQRKKTFILEQKLKKIERYKHLINKLTNLEFVYNINKENNAEKTILNKQSKLYKTYQPYTYEKYSNIIQTKNNNKDQTELNKLQQINNQQTKNSYFNKIINAINKYGFMGVGESIKPKSKNTKTISPQEPIEVSSKLSKYNDNTTFTNPELMELQKLIKKYTIKEYTPKDYSKDVLKIKYFNLDDNCIEYNNTYNIIENIKLLLSSTYFNLDNTKLDYSSRIKYDNIKLDTLNELLVKSKYNIAKCYFDKYSNNFKLNQFKSGCNYMDFNYDKVMINTIFKNKMLNTSQMLKYKIVDYLNQYYQNMDNSFKIIFI